MYTQYVNGYDKAMSVFQDTMKENLEFANLVSQFQVSDTPFNNCVKSCTSRKYPHVSHIIMIIVIIIINKYDNN